MTRNMRGSWIRWAAVVGIVATMVSWTPASAVSVPGTACSVFPADNVWHLDVSGLRTHRRSDVWKRAMHASSSFLHPDFGPPSYGIPYDVVTAAHPDVSVSFTWPSESDPGPYPFGPDTHIEGGADAHAIMVDGDACRAYELYAADWNAGTPTAGSGAVFDLSSNVLRPAGWTSADAAGLPIIAGLLRYDEVASGEIDHAIRMTAACTHDAYIWPARHRAGTDDRRCPPMGARFRLRARFDASGFGPKARVVIRALKRYGLIVADNGSDWYFQGTVDAAWPMHLLDQLKRIPARALVAVDEHACRQAKNSGRAAYGTGCPAP
jgi:hypothetical protein